MVISVVRPMMIIKKTSDGNKLTKQITSRFLYHCFSYTVEARYYFCFIEYSIDAF